MAWDVDLTQLADVSAVACAPPMTPAAILMPTKAALELDEAQQPETVTADRYQPSDSSVVVDTLD